MPFAVARESAASRNGCPKLDWQSWRLPRRLSPPITDGNDVDFAPILQRTGEDALTCTLSSRDFIGRTGVVRHNSCRFLIRDRTSESACSQSGQPGARAVPARHAFVTELELL